MTAILKGPMCAFLLFAFVGLGKVYAGFYDEVKTRAMRGDPEAQDLLSYMYKTGRGVSRDVEQARRWEELARRGGVRGERMSPQRPRAALAASAVRASPRRPLSSAANYQGVRMAPRRPGEFASTRGSRARPRRPSPGAVMELARTGFRGSELGAIQRGIRTYQRGRKWHQRVARGGKLLVSPVTFTVKQSTRVVSKAFRNASFGSLALY